MTNPLVSVIIPAYNAEKFLAEALESVIRQTYSNWEVIVVDDGSHDRTAKIAQSYAAKDGRIKYVYQENRRMAAARNKGISLAQGQYIALLDSDNMFTPEKLATQVAFMETHPECGVSYGRIIHFFEGAPDVLYKNRNEAPIEKDAFRSLLWRNSINVLQVLIRKKYLDEFGAFRGEWSACDEQYVWVNLARHGVKFCALENVVGISREHRASDSSRRGHIYDTARSFLQMLKLIELSFSAEEKARYSSDFSALRKKYRRMFWIGWLVKTRPFSWVLLPLYLKHRDRNYTRIN